MKGQLIFRIFVDISSYLYEFFVLRNFIIFFYFFCSCTFIFHTWVRFLSLFHAFGTIVHFIIIIINQIIFTLSINIFCNSYKIPIKSFSNSLLISHFLIFKFWSLYFTSFLFLPDSVFIIFHVVLTLLWEFRINLSCSILFAFLITTDSVLE